jgi:hypothetical protein
MANPRSNYRQPQQRQTAPVPPLDLDADVLLKQDTSQPCQIPDCENDSEFTVDAQVAPGVKLPLHICADHKSSLDDAKKQAEDEALNRTGPIEIDDQGPQAPFGICHVCHEPVGIPNESQPLTLNGEIETKWWVHASKRAGTTTDADGNTVPMYTHDGKTACHAECRCKSRFEEFGCTALRKFWSSENEQGSGYTINGLVSR